MFSHSWNNLLSIRYQGSFKCDVTQFYFSDRYFVISYQLVDKKMFLLFSENQVQNIIS